MEPKEKVYNFISEQVTLGNLTPTDKITERFLSDNVGLSRTPIREALLQLASENILEREPRKGFKLKQYSQEEVENIYEIIGTLDGKIAYETCEKLTQEDYSVMQFLIDSMYSSIKNGLYTKYNELQESFHNVYISLSTNSIMVQELKNKKKIFVGKNYKRITPETIQNLLKTTNDEHQTILNLFKNHQKNEVRKYLEEIHWNKSNARYDIW